MRHIVNKIVQLDPKDPFRTEKTQLLLDKLCVVDQFIQKLLVDSAVD